MKKKNHNALRRTVEAAVISFGQGFGIGATAAVGITGVMLVKSKVMKLLISGAFATMTIGQCIAVTRDVYEMACHMDDSLLEEDYDYLDIPEDDFDM